MFWLAGLLIAAGAVAAFWHFGSQRKIYRGVTPPDFARFFRTLVLMTPQSFLMAERESGDGFVQFALVSARGNWSEIELGIPDVDWSAHAFDRIYAALREAGFSPKTEQNPGGIRFMRTRIAGELRVISEAGVRLADLMVRELQWPDARFTLHFDGNLRPRGA